MNKFFLKLLGYRYVTDASFKRNVHTFDCSYAKRINSKTFLTEKELARGLADKSLDGCFRCMPERSLNKVGRPKKVVKVATSEVGVPTYTPFHGTAVMPNANISNTTV